MSCKQILSRRKLVLICLPVLFFFCSAIALADVTLPAVIGDNMVLQQDKDVPIWGWADPCEKIIIKFGVYSVAWGAIADKDGKWITRIGPLKGCNDPQQMTIQGENNQVTVNNILVGEVWVCSGQSNMEMGLGLIQNARQEIANANYPNIRLFHVPLGSSGCPESNVDAVWKPCTSKNISSDNIWEGWPKGFSAVAYFFGRQLHKKLDVPVGLIAASWGGTRIEPWTPPAGFSSVAELKDILKEIEQANLNYKKATKEAAVKFQAWARGSNVISDDKPVPPPPAWPEHELNSHRKPTGLYNAMVHPLVPFAIRGAIWYQGEANLDDGMLYCEKMKALINGWRKVWEQDDFPFYFVQLAPYRYRWGPPAPYRLPVLWQAQLASLSIPNTGMAVTVDISDLDDIHPKNKQEVGRRLSLWALAKTYGLSDLVYSGPLYKAMTVEDGRIRISFDHTGTGLRTSDSRPPNWFEIAGADKNFVTAQAKIDGNTVLVWSDAVPRPVAVRFGWHEEAEPNLINKEGLPASPFHTDY